MFITVLLFVLFGILLHTFLLHYGKTGRLINAIPGPLPMPIIGNLYNFQASPLEIWKRMRAMGAMYYPIYRLWSLTFAIVNVRHPDDIETVLGSPKFTKKSFIYNLLEPWFGTGLLTSSGHKWQVRRKILTPAFHFNVLQQFTNIFIEEGGRLVELLKSEGKPVVKNLLPLISEHTLNVICETAMGTSLKDKGEFQHKYRNAVYSMGKVFVYRMSKPWYNLNFLFNIVPQGRLQAKLLKILHGFTRQIIQERKIYHEETNDEYLRNFNDKSGETNGDDDDRLRKKRLAMLDLLIAAHRQDQIGDEGIREEVDTFMFRGHDTTAMGICFAIMLFAEHKEIQDRARAEAIAVMNESGGKLTTSALQNLSYLERCIKECLRLYPSVPVISRQLESEVQLSNYVIPNKTVVHVHIYDVHRDPKYWPNPDVFDPDRFLPENSQGRHSYCYVPFSAGPRNCIGQRFAMLELKVTLALLLCNFSFEPVDYLKDLVLIADMVIRSSHPIRTKFVPLDVSSCT